MTNDEKEHLLTTLSLIKDNLQPISEKGVATATANYDALMEGVSKTSFPEFKAELLELASKQLGYVEEHKEPLKALQRTIDYAQSTEASVLTRERVKQIAEESGWLSLRSFA